MTELGERSSSCSPKPGVGSTPRTSIPKRAVEGPALTQPLKGRRQRCLSGKGTCSAPTPHSPLGDQRGTGDRERSSPTHLTRVPFLFRAGTTAGRAENGGLGLRGPHCLSCPTRGSCDSVERKARHPARLHSQEREVWKFPSPSSRAALRYLHVTLFKESRRS